MEYPPPTFSFSGLQFNPEIFENQIVEAVGGVVPDPLPIGELDTNNIQAENNANPVTLYTTLANSLTLGNTLINQLFIKTKSALFGDYGIGTSISMVFTSLLSVACEFYGDIANPSIKTANIVATPSPTFPLTSNNGSLRVQAYTLDIFTTELLTPANVLARNNTLPQALYYDHAADISLGNTSGTGTLLLSNTIRSQILANTLNLFTGQTGQINLGSTGVLRLTNNIISNVVGSTLDLFSSQTGQINLGSSGILRLTNNIVSNAIGSTLDLFTTQTGQINLGGATAGTIRLLNTLVSNATANALSLFTTQTGDISLGGTGQITNNVSNFFVKGVGANVNISKRTQPSVGGVTDVYFADGGRPTLASGTIEINSNNSVTSNDGNITLTSRTNTLTGTLNSLSATTNTLSGTTTNISGNNGNFSTTTTTFSGTGCNLNSATTTINGSTLQLSSTVIELGDASTTNLNINKQMTPAYGSYNTTTGTAVIGSIGYVYNGTYAGNTNITSGNNITAGTITSIPVGVYVVTCVITFVATVAGQISYSRGQTDLQSAGSPFAVTGICHGTASGNCTLRDYQINCSGVTTVTTPINIVARVNLQFVGGTYTTVNGGTFTNFFLRAVRIA